MKTLGTGLNEPKGLNCKIYPLRPEEQQQLVEFLEEDLESGQMSPSK
jgi:hypothetical protein